MKIFKSKLVFNAQNLFGNTWSHLICTKKSKSVGVYNSSTKANIQDKINNNNDIAVVVQVKQLELEQLV